MKRNILPSYLDQSVIHGTLKTNDLIITFAATLKKINETEYNLWGFCSTFYSLLENADQQTIESVLSTLHDEHYNVALIDVLNYEVAELIEALDRLAPENYYFGVHPSDGSDFGFWRSEE